MFIQNNVFIFSYTPSAYQNPGYSTVDEQVQQSFIILRKTFSAEKATAKTTKTLKYNDAYILA